MLELETSQRLRSLALYPYKLCRKPKKEKPMSVSFLLLKKMWRLLSRHKQQVELSRNTYHDEPPDLAASMQMMNVC